MRPLLFAATLAATCVVALVADDAPQMTEISQKAAKPGEIITVSGLGLSTKNVDEIYLTDHKFDMRVKVVEQKDTTVKIRIPPFAKPGRMQLLFLTKGDEPKLLEQPLYLLIDDPQTEIATAKVSSGAAEPNSSKTDEARPEPVKEQGKADQAKPESMKEQIKPDAKLDQIKPDSRQPK